MLIEHVEQVSFTDWLIDPVWSEKEKNLDKDGKNALKYKAKRGKSTPAKVAIWKPISLDKMLFFIKNPALNKRPRLNVRLPTGSIK